MRSAARSDFAKGEHQSIDLISSPMGRIVVDTVVVVIEHLIDRPVMGQRSHVLQFSNLSLKIHKIVEDVRVRRLVCEFPNVV